MKEYVHKHKYILFSLIVIFFIYLYFIIFNDSVFLFEGDSYEQQYKFYVEAWNRLRNNSLPFWDWSNFLGNNYFGSSTFYFLGSPFFWLVMLLPSDNLIQHSFLYINLLKSVLCVLFSYIWLYKINKNSFASSIGGLITTFSSFVLFNYTNNHIFDAVCFIPLCLYFIERYLQDKKTLGLSLSIGYLGIINYYFLYLFIPFCCIYALVRYFVLCDKISIKGILKDGGVFVLRVLLGILISCVMLLPSFFVLRGNPRTVDLFSLPFTVGKLTYYRFLTSFLTPICDWRMNFNSFISINVNPGVGWGGGFADYSLIISVFCSVLLFFVKDKKKKVSGYVLLGIYAVFAMFPFFYVLFNQNYESRWVYIFTFILAYIVSIVISNIHDIKPKHFIISGIIVLLLIGGSYLVTNIFHLNDIAWEQEFIKRNCLITSTLIIIYIIIFAAFNNKPIINYLIILIVFTEIVFSFYSTFYGTGNKFYEPMSKETLDQYNNSYQGAVEFIKEKDNTFYRIDKDKLYDSLGGNDVHLQRYKSFYGYHSIYNYNQLDFIKDRFTSYWLFEPQTGKDVLKSMFGSKYWFTYTKEGDYLAPYGYSYMNKLDDNGSVYINDYPITFGFLREKTISKEDFDSFDTLHQDYLLLDHVVINDPDDSDKQSIKDLDLVSKEQEQIIIPLEVKGMYYISYSNKDMQGEYWTRPNWHLFDSNNKELYSNYIDGEQSYVGLNIIEDKYKTLDIRHIFSSEVYYDDMSWYEDWYNSQEMIDPDSVKWDDNSISGTITVSKDGYFVSSVPYDKGWTVKLDGKKIDYLKVNEGFVGFEITKGTHTVEMNYVPPGLIFGSIISAISLAFCILLESMSKKKIVK